MVREVEALTDALLEASRALVAVAARSLADVDDVTLPQFRALVVSSRPTPVTVGDLAAALAIHPSTATRMCDRLERKQLLRRNLGVSTDRRETTLSLTPRGRRLVDRVTQRRRRDLAAIAAAMPSDKRDAVIAALVLFADAAADLPVVDPFGWTDPVRVQGPATGA
jgi:DNA-binding MarR family transcriptional regulator